MSQVDCQGNEFSIFDCDYEESNWCSHQHDAGVICDKPDNGEHRGSRLHPGDETVNGFTTVKFATVSKIVLKKKH